MLIKLQQVGMDRRLRQTYFDLTGRAMVKTPAA
jgi:hypothetical protein